MSVVRGSAGGPNSATQNATKISENARRHDVAPEARRKTMNMTFLC